MLMSDVANGARFGARFIPVLVITETERKRPPNRTLFATRHLPYHRQRQIIQILLQGFQKIH